MPKRTMALSAIALLLVPVASSSVACGGRPAEEAQQAASAPQDEARASEPSLLQRIFRREPERRTVPAGTVVAVRFLDSLSSHTTSPGAAFRAEVTQDVSVDGRTAIPQGAAVLGTVSDAHPAQKIGGRAILSLDFHTLELPSGDSYPIAAAFSRRGKSEAPKDAAIIGGGTLGGALLGEAVHEGEGGVIGAVVGGLAGALGAKKTQGKPLEVAAGTVMSIELSQPVEVTLG